MATQLQVTCLESFKMYQEMLNSGSVHESTDWKLEIQKSFEIISLQHYFNKRLGSQWFCAWAGAGQIY